MAGKGFYYGFPGHSRAYPGVAYHTGSVHPPGPAVHKCKGCSELDIVGRLPFTLPALSFHNIPQDGQVIGPMTGQ